MMSRMIADLIEVGLILTGQNEYAKVIENKVNDKYTFAEICNKVRVEFLRRQVKSLDNKYSNITDFLNNEKDETIQILNNCINA